MLIFFYNEIYQYFLQSTVWTAKSVANLATYSRLLITDLHFCQLSKKRLYGNCTVEIKIVNDAPLY